MITGIRDFSGGETLQERVYADEHKKLALCSGYRGDDKSLVPEKLAKVITSAGLDENDLPLASQAPASFVQDGATVIVARDASENIRAMVDSTDPGWSPALGRCGVVAESLPSKTRDQIIFPGKGDSATLTAFEPLAQILGADSVRPLAFKGPLDYSSNVRPSVIPSDPYAAHLFLCGAVNTWTAASDAVTVTNTETSTEIAISSSAAAGALIAKQKTYSHLGVPLSGCAYLVLDIAIKGDPQEYTQTGVFPNDPLMAPSGYMLEFYSDDNYTELVKTYHLPKCEKLGVPYRVAINISSLPAFTVIKSMALRTTAFWDKPVDEGIAPGVFTICLWSEPFDPNWAHKGAFLLPPVIWNKGAWAEALSVTNEQTNVSPVLPVIGNIIANNSFEEIYGSSSYRGAKHWEPVAHGSDSVGPYGRTGAKALILRNKYNRYAPVGYVISNGGESVDGRASVVAQQSYWFEFYHRATADVLWAAEVIFHKADHSVPDDGVIRFPGADEWYTSAISDTWQLFKTLVVAPLLADHVHIRFIQKHWEEADFVRAYTYIDDVAFYPVNIVPDNCAYILQVASGADGSWDSTFSSVEYVYSYLGTDRLAAGLYNHMISNPSDKSSPAVFADPWRTYDVIMTTEADEWEEEEEEEEGEGGGEEPEAPIKTVVDEYGDYVTHALVYRRIHDGATQTWSDFEFIAAVPIASTMTYTDASIDSTDAMVNNVPVPAVLEVNNDYLATARHVCYRERRVKAFTLNWSQIEGKWGYLLGVAISSDGKPWAFPTGVSEEVLVTDGMWTEVEAVTGSEIRGVLATQNDEFVALDTEYFVLRGDNPQSGWRFIRGGGVGLADGRCWTDCNGVPIGLAPDGYFYAYIPGNTKPVSKFEIARTIDLSKPHDAVFCQDRFIFLCNETSEAGGRQKLLIRDHTTGAWTTRIYSQRALVGMCTDGVRVFGVSSDGCVVDMFNAVGGTAADQTHTVTTAFLQIAPEGYDVQVTGLLVEVETDQDALNLAFTINSKGRLKASPPITRALTVNKNTTRYRVPASLLAEAVQVSMTYVGANPPTIRYLGVEHDTEPVR